MAKPGRKKFDIASHLESIERLAALGLTQKEICISLGFSHQTMAKYKRINSELVDALKRGRARAHEELTNILFTAATKEKTINRL